MLAQNHYNSQFDFQSLFINYRNDNKSAFKATCSNIVARYSNNSIPGYYAWNLDIINSELKYIGDCNVCINLHQITVKSFKEKIHPSFQQNFTCIVKEFFLEKNKGFFNNNRYVSFKIPFKLEGNSFKSSKLTIKPIFTNHVLSSFILIINPIEEYSAKHTLNLEVFNNGVLEQAESFMFRNCIQEPICDFTNEQQKTLDLIEEGCNCCEISELLSKSKHATFKINRRITEKISEFYNLDFKDIYEAVKFYKNCC